MAQHTPGPWTVSQSFGNTYFIESGGLVDVAMGKPRRHVTLISGEDSETETRGSETITRRKPRPFAREDAYLIAAAPELLAALKDLIDATQHYCTGPQGIAECSDEEMYGQARAAIAKAEAA